MLLKFLVWLWMILNFKLSVCLSFCKNCICLICDFIIVIWILGKIINKGIDGNLVFVFILYNVIILFKFINLFISMEFKKCLMFVLFFEVICVKFVCLLYVINKL